MDLGVEKLKYFFKKVVNIFRNEKKEESPSVFTNFSNFFNSPTPVYLIDEDFNLLWYNEAFRKNLFKSDGTKCYEALFNNEFVCKNCPAIKSIQDLDFHESIVFANKKHNKIGTIKIVSLPVNLNGGRNVLNFIQNVQYEIEEAKSKQTISEIHKLDEIVADIPIPIFLINRALDIISCNKNAIDFLKIDSNTPEIKKLKDFLIFEQQTLFESILANLLNNKTQTIIAKAKTAKMNHPISVICQISPLKSVENVFILVLKPIEGVTIEDFKKYQTAEILGRVFDVLPFGIIIHSKHDATFIENQQAKEIFKQDKSIMNRVRRESLAENDFARKSFEHKSENGKYKISLFNVQSETTDIAYRVSFIENISEFDKLQKELTKTKNLMEQINRFVHVASLTIDSEYNIIDFLGKIEGLIEEKYDKFSEQKIKFVDLIYPEDSFKVNETLSELFHFPNLTKELDFRIKKQNEFLWIKGIFVNEADERGKILNVRCFLLDTNEQKKVEEQLKASQEEMRNLALYFESLREEEKKKLAFEIHDELGHLLTAMKLEMSWILKKKYLREDVLHEKLIRLIEMVETTIKKVRSISSQLRPSILDHFGIVAAIEWQAKEFQRQTAIRCRINLTKQDIQLDEAKAIVVFRVFQEILTNIARHANATRVDVSLDVVDNNLILAVSDNGKGIKQEDITSKRSLGITGMKERANSVDGKLTIQGVSNVGTTVTLTIPIN